MQHQFRIRFYWLKLIPGPEAHICWALDCIIQEMQLIYGLSLTKWDKSSRLLAM